MGTKSPTVISDSLTADVVLELSGKRPGSEQTKRRARSASGLSTALGAETADILSVIDASPLIKPLDRQSRAGRTLYGVAKGLQIVDLRGAENSLNPATVKFVLGVASLQGVDVSKLILLSDGELPGLETQEPTSSEEVEVAADENAEN